MKSSTDDVLDLAFSGTPLDFLAAESVVRWDITPGIERFMVSDLAPTGRRGAVEQIVRVADGERISGAATGGRELSIVRARGRFMRIQRAAPFIRLAEPMSSS